MSKETDNFITEVGNVPKPQNSVGILKADVKGFLNIITNENWIMKREQIFWKRITNVTTLTGWLTNKVNLIELEWWEKVVMKIGTDLSREADFFWFVSKHKIKPFPKLLEMDDSWNILIFEFKEWINWKDIVDWLNGTNWKTIWNEFWEILNNLHSVSVDIDNDKKQKSIKEMLGYLSVKSQLFEQSEYDNEINKLRELLLISNQKFVMLHWDFSPHNCLFEENQKWIYSISTVLDPSGRVSYWVGYFDVVYLLNTRWNKNKEQLRKWFIEKYSIDFTDPLLIQFEKVMRMYLAEIYFAMWDEASSKEIIQTI